MKDSANATTVRDIALVAGVSAMTVSRALRGSPLQNKETIARVQRIARELGWKPNPLVSALMSQRVRRQGVRASANLAILDPRHDEPHANRDHVRGALHRASELGYRAEVFAYRPAETSPERLRKILLARGIRGVLMMPLPIGVHEVAFDFDGFAAATIGHSLLTPALHRVANDTQANVILALRHYEELGYRRVGLIMADDANRRMLCQYTSAADSYDRFFSSRMRVRQLILPDERFTASDMRRVIDWIERNRLQGIFSSAEHLRRRLIKYRVTIPAELAYIHLHRPVAGTGAQVTCMDQLRGYIGSKAIDLVTSMIQRNETFPTRHPQIILTPSELITGETVPDLRFPGSVSRVTLGKGNAQAKGE